MSDLLMKVHGNRATAWLAKAIGLPNPVNLAREPGAYVAQPLLGKNALLCRTSAGYAAQDLQRALGDAGATLPALASAEGAGALDVVVMDATGCTMPGDYRALYDSFHPILRSIARNGRVLIVAHDPLSGSDPVASAIARGIEGYTRSLAKEVGPRGITVNLAYVVPGGLTRMDGPLRFFCGTQTTYVTGQAFRLADSVRLPSALPLEQVLKGKVALVTGAARGIGRATAERLAQEGAQVVALDVGAVGEELESLCARLGAVPLMMDIAAAGTPERLADLLMERWGGVDIIVHNAGITRDRTHAKMSADHWDAVVNVNLAAILAVDAALLSRGVMRDEGRFVCLSSISGIAGNFGQTNYAASKAALVGYVAAQAPGLAVRGICINAVAPGFIATAMTDAMPFLTREVGGRLNSLKQAGQPRDVAELITFLCTPGAAGISGQTIRVCGQGLIGA